SYIFYRRGQSLAVALCFAAGLISGELAAFIFLGLGIALLLGGDGMAWGKRYGVWLVGLSIAWLIISLVIISPSVRVPEQQNLFGYHYKQWNVTSAAGL